LEAAFAQSIGDRRFLPHVQLHEYEALLYCDLNAVKARIEGSERSLERLREEVRHLNPEDINEGRETAPSKRLIHAVPAYEKLKAGLVGRQASASVCPLFGKDVLILTLGSAEWKRYGPNLLGRLIKAPTRCLTVPLPRTSHFLMVRAEKSCLNSLESSAQFARLAVPPEHRLEMDRSHSGLVRSPGKRVWG
jgi:hypothetical protein